jgi:hypothetical protein
MTLTRNQYPVAYVPDSNDQTFEYTSSQIGNADFKYIVVVTDLLTSASLQFNIKQAPNTGELKWYANVFTNNYVKHYVPNNVYGFQVCTDAIRKIQVEVKEYYLGNTVAASPPSITQYIVWNGVLRALDWVDYDYTDFVYRNTDPFKYLFTGTPETGYRMPRGVTFSDKSLYLYTLADVTNTFETLRVKTYDVNGTLLGTSDITNPYYNDASYQNKYFCIDVGYKGLSQISSGLVTGTYPIITSSVSYYELFDVNSSVGSPPVGTEESIRRVDIGCEPSFTVYALQYVAKSGNVETLNCNKLSELRENITGSSYRINPNTLSANQWKYTKFSEWEKVIGKTGQENLILNTDWLTQNQMEIYREIFTSPKVWIDYGSTIGLVPCLVQNRTVFVEKDFNNKLKGYTIEVEPTVKNNYQHG